MLSWKKIGRVGPPQGLNGSFFLLGEGHKAPQGDSLILGEDPHSGIPATIEQKSKVQGRWLLRLRGIENREALEYIRGQTLWTESQSVGAERWEGVAVHDALGELIGDVLSVENHGASDIAVIQHEQSFLDLPLVEAFFAFEESSETMLKLQVSKSELVDLWYSQ